LAFTESPPNDGDKVSATVPIDATPNGHDVSATGLAFFTIIFVKKANNASVTDGRPRVGSLE
jgi:hypothetical protein